LPWSSSSSTWGCVRRVDSAFRSRSKESGASATLNGRKASFEAGARLRRMDESQTVYVSAGSNLGDRLSNLRRAVVELDSGAVEVRRVSSTFETEPLGYADQPWFLNLALELRTRLSPREMLRRCQAVETSAGRVRSFPNAP